MSILYVNTPGAKLSLDHDRIRISYPDSTEITELRLRELEQVVLMGPAYITTQTVARLLDLGVETAFLSSTGRYRGRLASPEGKNVFLRKAQFDRLNDTPFRLFTSGRIVRAKIAASLAVMRRYLRHNPGTLTENDINRLTQYARDAEDAESLQRLRGIEGEAAALYFANFSTMLKNQQFSFEGRNRRPPKDPMNSLLSFGYAGLLTEVVGAVCAVGMDPAVGVLHELEYSRPSLALDMIEEFRHFLIDRMILAHVNRGYFKPEHFYVREEGGTYMTQPGRRLLVSIYQQEMVKPYTERLTGQKTDMRRLIARQARRMKNAIMGRELYQPIYFGKV